MDFELRSDRGRLPRSGLVVSGGLHLVVLLGLLFAPALRRQPVQFESFQIELVATSPEPVPLPPVTEDLVIETPDPSPPSPPDEVPPPDPRPNPDETPPPPDDPVVDDPEPEPEPEPVDPPVEDPPTTTSDDPPPETPVDEAPEEETGSNVTVRMEGLKRDFPVYYANIVQQIQNCWRPPPGNSRWRVVLYFEIKSDGTVQGVEPVQRSGSAAFDLSAIGAVADCAGRGRFGPLPDEMPFEILPVQFTLEPRGIGGG